MSFFKIREILEYFFQYELFQYEWYEMNFELLFKNILPDLWILSYLKIYHLIFMWPSGLTRKSCVCVSVCGERKNGNLFIILLFHVTWKLFYV